MSDTYVCEECGDEYHRYEGCCSTARPARSVPVVPIKTTRRAIDSEFYSIVEELGQILVRVCTHKSGGDRRYYIVSGEEQMQALIAKLPMNARIEITEPDTAGFVGENTFYLPDENGSIENRRAY